MAQNGKYFISATLTETDCTNNTAYFDIKIKATDANSSFLLADQNYRISYSSEALVPNSAFIEREGDVSGLVTTDGSMNFFEEHSLNGSQDTIISYNIEHLGGDGYLVKEDQWVSIGRIGIEIADPEACFTLFFHDTETFPPTYIGENVQGLLVEVEEGAYHNVEDCLSDYCGTPSIIGVEFPINERYSTALYPTTTGGNLVFEYTGVTTTQALNIIITNAAGQPVQRHQSRIQNSDKLHLDVSNLPQGMYIFSTLLNGEQVTEKFIKI